MIEKAARVDPEVEKALVRYARMIREEGVAAGKPMLEEYSERFPIFAQLAANLVDAFQKNNLFKPPQ